MLDRLERMKETLTSAVEMEICNLGEADTEELGKVIDMIKDLEEAIYYCAVTKAMEEWGEKEEGHFPPERMYFPNEKMYYSGGRSGNGRSGGHQSNSTSRSSSSSNGGNGEGGSSSSYYSEREYPYEFRDHREGRSPHSRRMYMEAKETHQDKTSQMRELEKYMQELTQDMVEMIEGATAEERQFLSKKISVLANKVAQTNG